MKRYLITQGAKTTAGGTVLEGESASTVSGVPIAYEGAHVYCPSCNSNGVGANVQPFHTSTLNGKQVLLEGDLCVCKCSPSPKLLAAQSLACQSFEEHEAPLRSFEQRPMGDAARPSTAASPTRIATCWVLLRDSTTGEPMPNHVVVAEVGGRHVQGFTDANGYAVIRSNESLEVNFHSVFVAPRRTLKFDKGM
ncbi:PAAR domain-containing protein [Dyella sp. C11]|uniref:PAAR domain-containing protein n=1 Tax=Dyella sp. C11 TaxID=2126991 RepID=UPI000D65E924|nr:PAAR domain-containing protein [Dyella sp. C11]